VEEPVKRLLIVADHSLVVHTMRLALRQTAGFQVVGFVDGRTSARAALAEHRPEVVLVDDMQNHEHALERLRDVSDVVPSATALLLTLRMEDDWLAEVFAAGAHAVISKTVHPVALGTLLREVAQRNVVQRHRPGRARAGREQGPLTDRELEILDLAAQGHTNGQIARELWVTEQTVKFHLSNTYRKLGVSNRTEASRYAHLNDLVGAHERLAS
jgi:DNA-binding NarL/FixJ family response regulator